VNHSTENSSTAANFHALGEGTDDQRAGDAGEGRLEGDEHHSGMYTPLLKVAATESIGDALQEQLVERADERVAAPPKASE
jgi:hypothetical protein